jgi:hypothetical protein
MSERAFDRRAVSSLPHWSQAAGVGLSITAIWVAVVLTSVFSPDLISGSEQEHLPIAALTNSFWGSVVTVLVLIAVAIGRGRSLEDGHEAWFLMALATATIWAAVTVVSISAPRLVTGTDPTQIPLAAMISPVVGTMATGLLTWAVALLSTRRTQGGPLP